MQQRGRINRNKNGSWIGSTPASITNNQSKSILMRKNVNKCDVTFVHLEIKGKKCKWNIPKFWPQLVSYDEFNTFSSSVGHSLVLVCFMELIINLDCLNVKLAFEQLKLKRRQFAMLRLLKRRREHKKVNWIITITSISINIF